MATRSSVLHTSFSICLPVAPTSLNRPQPGTDGQRDVRGDRPPFQTLFSRVAVHSKLPKSQPKALGLTAAEEEGVANHTAHPRGWL